MKRLMVNLGVWTGVSDLAAQGAGAYNDPTQTRPQASQKKIANEAARQAARDRALAEGIANDRRPAHIGIAEWIIMTDPADAPRPDPGVQGR